VVGCRCGYLSGQGAEFAYGPADTTTTHCPLLLEIQIGFGFTFLLPAQPGSPGQNAESHKAVVVVVFCSQTPLAHCFTPIAWNMQRISHLENQQYLYSASGFATIFLQVFC